MSEKRATLLLGASLSAKRRSSIAWHLARKKMAQGEGIRETLLWAVRNCAELPPDPEFRDWLAAGLAGTLETRRGRGRPRKQQRPDLLRISVESRIKDVYDDFVAVFRRDRDLAWLRAEAVRLRQQRPDAAVWRRTNDLGTETGRRAYEAALAELGSRPCPKTRRGAETARDLALRATADQCRAAWTRITGAALTPSVVARVVTRVRARKVE